MTLEDDAAPLISAASPPGPGRARVGHSAAVPPSKEQRRVRTKKCPEHEHGLGHRHGHGQVSARGTLRYRWMVAAHTDHLTGASAVKYVKVY